MPPPQLITHVMLPGMEKLTPEQINEQLVTLDDWHVDGEVLSKTYVFRDFVTAIDCMTRLVPTAEKLNHHPDWSNSYNKLTIRLTSHDLGGLTEDDFNFARAADTIANSLIEPTV